MELPTRGKDFIGFKNFFGRGRDDGGHGEFNGHLRVPFPFVVVIAELGISGRKIRRLSNRVMHKMLPRSRKQWVLTIARACQFVHIVVFPERSGLILDEAIRVDMVDPGQYTRVRYQEKRPLPAGRRVTSYLLQLDAFPYGTWQVANLPHD
jgi:hypothetical protein